MSTYLHTHCTTKVERKSGTSGLSRIFLKLLATFLLCSSNSSSSSSSSSSSTSSSSSSNNNSSSRSSNRAWVTPKELEFPWILNGGRSPMQNLCYRLTNDAVTVSWLVLGYQNTEGKSRKS
ncbi:hypothetical protein M0802_000801 [Mischocyttarus mexicanus]|nr:hypothetical protein M0802_000801 [Mischocyttarus mexicanus]